YLSPPQAFSDDPFLGWIAVGWRSSTSVYGPVWSDLSAGLAWITSGLAPMGQLFVFRLLLSLTFSFSLIVVWRLLGRLAPRARLSGLVAFAWSPLLLLQIAANAHNEGLALLLMLLACLPLVRLGERVSLPLEATRLNRAYLISLVLIALATLVKWLPGL